MKKVFTVVFICFSYLCVFGQSDETANTVGINFSIESKVFKEKREVQVFLPDLYNKSDKKYPVLFILDGQRLFLHGVSLQKSFVQFRQTPEFIVVGISSKERQRNRDFRVKAKDFLDFLEKEVIVFVDNKFRTSKERILFGWAFGGGFVMHTMTLKPNLFDVYIAASPFPVTDKINNIESLLSKNTKFDKSLYFTSATNEANVQNGTNKLNDILKKKAPKTFNWNFRELEGEEHRSTPFITLYHGIRNYYQYYPELQFNDLAEFKRKGGLPYVYNYYKKRAKDFGFPQNLTSWTMFSLTRNAIRANEYNQFDAFVNEFKGNEFINLLSVNRASSIAEYYLENKKYDKAKDIFLFLTKKYPKSARPLKGLGDIYKALKNETKAAQYYRKAKELKKN